MPTRFVHSILGGALATLALTFVAPVQAQPAPETPKPDAAKPDAAKPDAAKPDAAKPDAAKPDAAKPDAAKAAGKKDDAAGAKKPAEGKSEEETFELDDDDDDDDEAAAPKRHERDPTPAEEKAQHKHERDQPRPPLPPEVAEPEAPPWERRLEIGPDFALMIRPLTDGLGESSIKYEPAPAWGVHINWPVIKWVHFRPYFTHASHTVDIPQGAMSTDSPSSIGADAVIDELKVETFTLGAKLAPTWHFTERVRAWVALGVGWGRFSYPKMTVTESDGGNYIVRDRSGVFVEFPLGLGISVDIIERWLLIGYEATAAPITGQSGDAHERFQAIDALGRTRDVGPFGAIELSVVQTLGLSLIL